MAVRNESVRLSLQDDFSTGMAKAAVATEALRQELDRLGRVSVQSSRASARIDRDVDTIARSANRADSSINQLTGRLRLFADAALLLGPALSPIGGVALAGVAGLANQLGIAALAGGTALAAFQGFGDALGAMNDAQLEPTAENIEKARQAMADLSPATQEAVVAVQGLIPKLKDVRDAAAEGLMPGFVEGLDNLDPVLTRTEGLLSTMGRTLGDVFADGIDSLGTDRWADFFTMLETEGPATLGDLASITGDFAHGLSELWEAFAPLNRDFSDWLVDVGDSFDGWASGLSETDGFRDFIAYVRESGPQVADTFSALGGALVDIATAAAPLGGPALAALEGIARAVSALAESGAGSGLLTVAAGLTAVNRAMSIMSRAGGASFGGMFGGITAGAQGARSGLSSFRDDMRSISDSMVAFGSNADRTAAATQRMRDRFKAVGKAGAGIGALAVATSGLGDSLGVTNTMTLGLMGTMLGPWGAAIGGGVGLLMDMAAAGDEAAASQERLSTALRSGDNDFSGLQDAMRKSQEIADGYADSLGVLGMIYEGADLFFTGESQMDTVRQNAEDDMLYLADLTDGMTRIGSEFGRTWKDSLGRDIVPTMADLTQIAERAAPAMAALGISAEDLAAMNDVELAQAARDIADWTTHADSAAGRTDRVADAFANLNDAMWSTSDSAAELKSALDALLGPGLNVSAATDAFEGGLRDLDAALADNTRSLDGFGEGARQNREAVRGLATDLSGMLTAMAEDGAGPRQLARALRNGRADILNFGDAAGLSRKELNGFLNEIGLTPRMVRTVLRAQGFTDAQIEAMELREAFNRLPKEVRTDVKTNGIPKSQADIEALQRKYDLTPKQVQTLVNLQKAAAEAGIRNIQGLLNALNGKTANTYVNNTITTTYVTRRRNEGSDISGGTNFGPRIDSAAGNLIDYYASGGVRRERHVAQIAPAGSWRVWAEPETGGEAYIPLANDWRRDRAVAIWRETGRRLNQFAAGGLLEARVPAPVGAGSPVVSVASPSVSVGGARFQVFVGDQEVRALVRSEMDAQDRWEGGLDR